MTQTSLTPEALALHFEERGLIAACRDNFVVVHHEGIERAGGGYTIAIFISDELCVFEYEGVRRNATRSTLGIVQLCDYAEFDKLIDLVIEKMNSMAKAKKKLANV